MSIRLLTESDLPRLVDLRQLSFLDHSDLDDSVMRAHHVARLPHTWGHFDGPTLTSAAVVHDFEMYLAGKRVPVGGLASVLSAPETRRRGYVRALLHALLGDLRDKGTGWMLAYPFDPRFYARYGFASVPTGTETVCSAEELFQGPSPDAALLSEDPERVLGPIYDSWAKGYSLALCREKGSRTTWARILKGKICYVLEDAYAVFELEHTGRSQTLTLHDYAFSSPAGRDALFRFIGSFHGQVTHIRLHLPSDEPLAFDLRQREEDVPLQARIADITAALTPLTSTREEAVTVRVLDTFCDWNDGTFKLTLGSSGTVVERSGDDPDATLTVITLAQLVTGALSPAAALKAGRAEGDARTLGAIAALSRGRVPFIPGSDYF